MPQIILIYANCNNLHAEGDFSLAGNIGQNLAETLQQTEQDIRVILTSTVDGMARFENLYGKANEQGIIFIENHAIGLCALESFNSIENNVIAFIEANPCKPASTELLKKAISPKSKLLFLLAANKSAISDNLREEALIAIKAHHPGVLNHFNQNDILIGSMGLGPIRYGLPKITQADKLAPLSLFDKQKIPKIPYGFIYLAAFNPDLDPRIMAQYTKLTGLRHYVLIGNFAPQLPEIHEAIAQELRGNDRQFTLPTIDCYKSLRHSLMRKMLANASGDLVVSTGIMSSLEAMWDGKLTYYQQLEVNEHFVASYLLALKSFCMQEMDAPMFNLVVKLSSLLFASKPLQQEDLSQTQTLLQINPVREQLKEANREIIKKANGTLAPRLLSFIQKTSDRDSNSNENINGSPLRARL